MFCCSPTFKRKLQWVYKNWSGLPVDIFDSTAPGSVKNLPFEISQKMFLPVVLSTCLAVVIFSCHGLESKFVTKRAVSDNQEECFSIILNQLTNNDLSCSNVGNSITGLLGTNNAENIQTLGDSTFTVFCRPTCGRSILTAWQSCNITSSFEEEVQALIGVCGRAEDMSCFQFFDRTFNLIEDIENCAVEIGSGNQCSVDCRNLINSGERMYECCLNVPVDIRIAIGQSELNGVVDTTFSNCFQERPDRCKEDILINQTLSINELVGKTPSLSAEQIVCIATTLSANEQLQENDPECSAAASHLLVQINSDDLIKSISVDQSAISVFCRPTCGPVVIENWMGCNAYDNIKPEADFLIGLCGLHQGSTCYSKYRGLLDYLDDSFHCGQMADSVVCPTGCSTIYRNGVEDFGCCSDVFIDYLDAVIEVSIQEVTNTFFNICGVQVPDQCTTTALTSADSTTTAPTRDMEPSQCTSTNAATIYVPTSGLILAAMCSATLVSVNP